MSKINLVTLSLALILFLLPWTNVSCNGKVLATQSSLQSIYGGASVGDALKDKQDSSGSSNSSPTVKNGSNSPQDHAEYAYIIGLALAAVILGLIMAAMSAFNNNSSRAPSGLLAAAALALILLQAGIGFPINKALSKSMEATTPGAGGGAPTAAETQNAEALKAAMNIEATRTGWFYVELLLLAIPVGIFIYEKSQPPKRRAAMASPTAQFGVPPR